MLACVTKNFVRVPLSTFVKTSSLSCSQMSNIAAVVQMSVSSDITQNLDQARRLVSEAKHRGASVVFLPEACDYIGDDRNQSLSLAQPLEGETVQQFQQLAVKQGVWLSLGGVHTVTDEEVGRTSNTHVIINSEGKIVQTYNKTHLFDVNIPGSVALSESSYVTPGNCIPSPVSSPLGQIGLGICYDLRFAEHSLALAKAGAQILTYPSAFTVTTGQAHWESLLRARAIETQCYVIASAQTGKHNPKRSSYGHSMIIDPWGVILAQCGEGEGICTAAIDLNYLHKIRSNMPVQKHRRPDLYGHVEILGLHSTLPGKDFDFDFGPAKVPGMAIFYKSSRTVAFVNKKPVVEGHVLVTPIRIAKKIEELNDDEMSDLFCTVKKVDAFLQKYYGVDSTTISIQNGSLAGQSIPHVHVHILPRREGDFAENDDVYKDLQNHDKIDSGWRTDEEMEAESLMFREAWKKLK